MKSNRPLSLLIPILVLLTVDAAQATVANTRPSQIDRVSGALLLTLAVGDIVVIGQNLSPEVPSSTSRHVLGLGLVSLAVAFQLENSGLALAFAAGGSLATASSVGRMVHGDSGVLSHLAVSAAHRGIAIRGGF